MDDLFHNRRVSSPDSFMCLAGRTNYVTVDGGEMLLA